MKFILSKNPMSHSILFSLMTVGLSIPASASVTLWQQTIGFKEFEGTPGGWEVDGVANYVYNKQGVNPGPTSRSYDFLMPVGVDAVSGKTIYGPGQDGVNDLNVRSRVIDGSLGRFSSITADKRDDDLRGNAYAQSGMLKPGDHAVVVYELGFSNDLGLSAKDFSVRLTNVNSYGELYQWSMVTLGDYDSAPFDPNQIGQYRNTNYSNLAGSTFFNADGTLTGNAGTGQPLQPGTSMSQFLAGLPSSAPSGGVVAPGWFVNDDFNVKFTDGAEAPFVNPTAGFPDNSKPDTLSVGAVNELGMDPEGGFTDVTIWMGFSDVGFDTNGDGFTSTGASMRGMISFIDIGATRFDPLPEPGTASLAALVGMVMFLRRRRA